MTIEEAANLLGIGRNQAYDAARRGDIPMLRLGKRMLVLREPFEHMLGHRPGSDEAASMSKTKRLEQCDGCRYWEQTSEGIRGWCRRHAPMAFIGKRYGDAIWPMTNGLEWCGEWGKR